MARDEQIEKSVAIEVGQVRDLAPPEGFGRHLRIEQVYLVGAKAEIAFVDEDAQLLAAAPASPRAANRRVSGHDVEQAVAIQVGDGQAVHAFLYIGEAGHDDAFEHLAAPRRVARRGAVGHFLQRRLARTLFGDFLPVRLRLDISELRREALQRAKVLRRGLGSRFRIGCASRVWKRLRVGCASRVRHGSALGEIQQGFSRSDESVAIRVDPCEQRAGEFLGAQFAVAVAVHLPQTLGRSAPGGEWRRFGRALRRAQKQYDSAYCRKSDLHEDI
ncbi:MAG: hypothetical protein BWZ10_01762 [candidate division BRC1 bacterium ADurb.BinA364]|nr:MAG: hypothetical protein BWZ10_01762 [candidate division BRC1 bacterium ADurb.BinA364]